MQRSLRRGAEHERAFDRHTPIDRSTPTTIPIAGTFACERLRVIVRARVRPRE